MQALQLKLKEKAEAVKIRRGYNLRAEEVAVLYFLMRDEGCRTVNTIFKIGYLQGQKALKAEQKQDGGRKC